jgi:hypothetical protein
VLGPAPAGPGFVLDPRPTWLGAAHAALSGFFPVRATRTGWDYGSSFLLGELDRLGVHLDFSAMPGMWACIRAGRGITVVSDWLRSPAAPYHPSRDDYQRPGEPALALLEVPLARFRNTPAGAAKRLAWRVRNGCWSWTGLTRRVRLLTEPWDELPLPAPDGWAFFFHPEDLTPETIGNVAANVERLRAAGADFVTASEFRMRHDERVAALSAGAGDVPARR